jgi:hypothetical protein
MLIFTDSYIEALRNSKISTDTLRQMIIDLAAKMQSLEVQLKTDSKPVKKSHHSPVIRTSDGRQ